jgi:hypothetical protein
MLRRRKAEDRVREGEGREKGGRMDGGGRR